MGLGWEAHGQQPSAARSRCGSAAFLWGCGEHPPASEELFCTRGAARRAVTSSSTSASRNRLGICGSHQHPPHHQSGGCRDSNKIVIASYTIRAPGYSATGVSVRTDILHLLSLYDVGSPTELKEKPIGLNVLLDLALRDERSRPLSQ